MRIAERTAHFAEALETLGRRGPPRWPDKPYNWDQIEVAVPAPEKLRRARTAAPDAAAPKKARVRPMPRVVTL
ncbi:hypothetical protein AB2M62_08280 [Sphingomonas sp. MMS12-HWE2-04]|uniref:hypothetical protein n=1 Tax=Sphingomonas sp. MMS12-HWE2-04 TaxID=3234199 RepID=UPI00384C56F0